MIFQRSLSRIPVTSGLFNKAIRIIGSGSGRPFSAFSRNPNPFPGFGENANDTPPRAGGFSSFLQSGEENESRTFANATPPRAGTFRFPLQLGKENATGTVAGATPPRAGSFRSPFQLGKENEMGTVTNAAARPGSFRQLGNENETGTGRTSMPIDFVRGMSGGNGRDSYGRPPLHQIHMEQNADIVHVKLMRNNTFVTVTDSRGNKILGTSAGKLATKGGKVSRYSAETAAEDIGRKVRELRMKSVVVKLNGFTYFKKKKQAVLSFRDGYTNSRADVNPVVYIEDTTRKPHNGCRRRKQRRV